MNPFTGKLDYYEGSPFTIIYADRISADVISTDVFMLNGYLYPTDGPTDNEILKWDSALGRFNYEADSTGAAGGGIPGLGNQNEITYWGLTDAAISGDTGLTFNPTTNALTLTGALTDGTYGFYVGQISRDVSILSSDTGLLKIKTTILSADAALQDAKLSMHSSDIAVMKANTSQISSDIGVMKTLDGIVSSDVGTLKIKTTIISNDLSTLIVPKGGTGLQTITDGGIMLGSGTGAITPMGVLAKGSLVVGDGATDPVELTVGINGKILSADSSTASGLVWADPPAGGAGAVSSVSEGVAGPLVISPTTGAVIVSIISADDTTAGYITAANHLKITVTSSDVGVLKSKAAVTRAITQAGHGFAIGNVLKFVNTYAKAQADSSANAEVVGIVSATSGADDFTLLSEGYISGLAGLSANSVYFLSPSSAGALTTTEPTTVGQISKPVLIAISASEGYFFNFRGSAVTNTSSTVTIISSDVGIIKGRSFITKVTEDTLTNEQALSALATGYAKVTTTTGAVTTQAVPIPIADGGTGSIIGYTVVSNDLAQLKPLTINIISSDLGVVKTKTTIISNDLVTLVIAKGGTGSTVGYTTVSNDVGALKTLRSKGFALRLPRVSDDVALWSSPQKITITSVDLLVVGGTNVVGQLRVCNPSYSQPDVGTCYSADTTYTLSAGTPYCDASFSTSVVTKDFVVSWDTMTVSGTPTWLYGTIIYTEN